MSFVGLAGLLISLVSVAFAFPNRSRDRYLLGLLLLAAHLAATVMFYEYIKTHDADSPGYFYDPLGMHFGPMVFGTVFVTKFVIWMREVFGGSYFDHFLFFQSLGLVGIVLLTRVISAVQYEGNLPYTRASLLIFCLPSLYFWTCAIGKDAPLFLGSSLAVWAAISLKSRWMAFVAAVCIMMPFRPHIAFIAVMALMLSLAMDNRVRLTQRLPFMAVGAISAGYLVSTVGRSLSFDPSDPNSVNNFFEAQRGMVLRAPGTTTVDAGYFERLFSLLFRPFFFDASGPLGMIASLENAIFLLGFIAMLRNFRTLKAFFKSSLFAKYCVFFTLILTLLLAEVYYNIGLGLRQRVMAYPTLFPLLIVAWAVGAEAKRRRKAAAVLGLQPQRQAPQAPQAPAPGGTFAPGTPPPAGTV